MPGNGPKQKPGKFTYADYLTWPDDEVTTVVQPDVSVYCGGDKLARYERAAHDAPCSTAR